MHGPSPEHPWEASTEPAPAPTHPCPVPALSGAAGRAVKGVLRACSRVGPPSPNPSPVAPRGGRGSGALSGCNALLRKHPACPGSCLQPPPAALVGAAGTGMGGGTQPGCSHRGDAHGSAPTCGTRRCFSSRNHPAGPPLSERIPPAQCSSGVCSPSLISLPFSPVASLSCFQERFAKRPAVLQPLLRALAAQPPPETLSPHPEALRFAAGTRRELRCHRSGRRPAAPRVLVTWLSRFVWRHRNLLDFGTAGARGWPWWQ